MEENDTHVVKEMMPRRPCTIKGFKPAWSFPCGVSTEMRDSNSATSLSYLQVAILLRCGEWSTFEETWTKLAPIHMPLLQERNFEIFDGPSNFKLMATHMYSCSYKAFD